MNKEVLNPYQAQQKRIVFIEKAVAKGILDRIPLKEVSERSQNIALVYILNEELTGGGVGKIFAKPSGKPLTKQSVSQIKKRFLEKTWKHASPQLQDCHPLEELLIRKPIPLIEVNARIKRAQERGVNPKEIRDTEGIAVLRNARRTLRKRGIEIPLMPIFHEDLETRVEEAENDDKKLQKILDSFSEDYLPRYINKHRKDEKKVLVYLSPILREAGFHLHNTIIKTFIEKVVANNIRLRIVKREKYKQRYLVVFDKHRKRIIDVLKNDPDLQRFKENPVKQICGPAVLVPNIAKLKKKEGYESLGNLAFETLGILIGSRSKITAESLLNGCPIPVFRYRHCFWFTLSQKTEIQNFLRMRYQKLQHLALQAK